jgi:hypothetical protein
MRVINDEKKFKLTKIKSKTFIMCHVRSQLLLKMTLFLQTFLYKDTSLNISEWMVVLANTQT